MSAVPAKIGRYLIRGHLGLGGMAELFAAQRDGRGPLVCVKRISPEHIHDEHFVAEFAREVDLAILLRHPNIVRVHERGQDEAEGHFLVMELIDGPNLAALLGAHGPLEPDVVAHVGASLAHALIYIHHSDADTGRGPLIHCDISPHNILIDGSGTVRLADFGVAKSLGRTGLETLTRERGKAGYLAPEQLDVVGAGEEVRITVAADLFAMGLVLWRTLVGIHPYVEQCPPGRSLQHWIPAQLAVNARRRVVDAAPGAPAGLCDVIERLLQPLDTRISMAERALAALEPHVKPRSAAALGRLASSTPREIA